jgi:hypothetical protein
MLCLGLNLAVQVSAAKAGLLTPSSPSSRGSVPPRQDAAHRRTAAAHAELCDELKTAGIGLGLARLQMKVAGAPEETQDALECIHHDLQRTRLRLEGRGAQRRAGIPRTTQDGAAPQRATAFAVERECFKRALPAPAAVPAR